ncbi:MULTISPECIES: hypothetical protein [Janthinobacterium]|uniref:Uncharacterized protein n=1 Tax=Janthinobacterium lividum TaxID=29581 RepID=A0AAJ4MNP7_9BURK|nr:MULTISPECIES: hypothetical protein [Janthinobacterium]KAB0325162.1 hypothetical protein F3B38_15900 [Janthinobacterium lividum]QKY09226.1 hypothetical protein G8765_16700 [Janthinobacterium lividum]QSX94253.1 hypothetical protein J3P46_15980 [Janthinobacterium lividum]UGQ34023.1 hypothetical protein LSO07_15995 [Janthinobacterium sp. PLB04]
MTNQHNRVPLQIEHLAWFSQHLGGRFRAAGLRIQFHDNQEAGIQWKVACPEEYQAAILQGLREGMNDAFPQYLASRSVWITDVLVDDVNSSPDAFYRVSLLVVAQAKMLLELSGRIYNPA